MKILVYGDIGGHYWPFARSLSQHGIDLEHATFSDDTIVIQVGDLIHRGPDSDDCIEAVDEMLTKYPDQWIQLLGNHEGHHIGGPEFGDSRSHEMWSVRADLEEVLQRWYASGAAQLAVGLDSPTLGGETLITHAGLCAPLYERIVKAQGNQVGVGQLAAILNAQPVQRAFMPGIMLGVRDSIPGVAWAAAWAEVYASWLTWPRVPFHQIHGHSTVYYWNASSWGGTPKIIQECTEIDKKCRMSMTKIGGKRFIAIDQALGKEEPWFNVEPLIIDGEIL